MVRRIRLEVSGVVQGVGFRPYLHGLALDLGLGGFVQNDPRGVTVELEGPAEAIEAFLRRFRTSPPPLAHIQEIHTREMPPQNERTNERTFVIRRSERDGQRTALIAPDQATCEDCLRELRDAHDRRHRYPFINCTNCGPRYTIIRDVPYDRANTTMAKFAMCPSCRDEYEDSSNRRFHAEPTCCPACGPRVELADRYGTRVACADPIQEGARRLLLGDILAVKGIGGFHLACDASNAGAVRLLRRRKQRDLKPFALMVKDIASAERICEVPPEASRVLAGRERPILLMKKRDIRGVAEEVAPRSASLGILLPYAPLHALLMEGPLDVLVMTSGNISDEPIAFTNEDALRRLHDIADCFLLHDRDIHIRTDDSVARIVAGEQRFLRRSRGYAPFPVALPVSTRGHEILAVGAELSNTVCITREGQAFLSHHLGDLQNLAAYEAFLQAVDHLKNLLAVSPSVVACDMHPDYASTRYARASPLSIVPVQHHHAHIASVLVENGHSGKVIGIAFDGLGWGEDATEIDALAWGGEFLVCDLSGFKRVGHLAPVPLPGADAAAKRTERMAYVYLRAAFGEQADRLSSELLPDFTVEEKDVVAHLCERRVKCPRTSSMGRLFDATSALLGICTENTYHAQAPMELEAEAWGAPEETGAYAARIESTAPGVFIVRASDIIRGVVDDYRRGTPRSVCAARFHNAVAHVTTGMCNRLRDSHGLSTAALSGGVFANAFLLERMVPMLQENGFEVLLNSVVPAGDGGISLGQAAVAAWRLQ